MKDKFTRYDLKDGMVVTFNDGREACVVIKCGQYINPKDVMRINNKVIGKANGIEREIVKIQYGEDIVYEKETQRMTTEEIRQKLEKLTGEKIEVEPSREEMIGHIDSYCCDRICGNCVLHDLYPGCCFAKMSNEKLKECYEKVMEDGRN